MITTGHRSNPVAGSTSPITSAAWSCQGIAGIPSNAMTLLIAGPNVGPSGRGVAYLGGTEVLECLSEFGIGIGNPAFRCHGERPQYVEVTAGDLSDRIRRLTRPLSSVERRRVRERARD